MKIGVLTSSRADFGIYLPLLLELRNDPFFDLTIIAFGTHHSSNHGYTIEEIIQHGFDKIDEVCSILTTDDKESISKSFGMTVTSFATYWNQTNNDVVLCLGDRYEMCAAVQAGIPFGITFAHFHGGEVTTGAIDNIYRDQISLASTLHFTSLDQYSDRLKKLLHSENNIHTVGSLSLAAIKSWKPQLNKTEFLLKYGIGDEKFILITFHPETVNPDQTPTHISELKKTLLILSDEYNLVITLPNADTFGSMYTAMFNELKNQKSDHIVLIQSFGKAGYFHALLYSSLVLGNSSSGILEAASFGKHVVNVGDRQNGRVNGPNIIHCDFCTSSIVNAVYQALKLGNYNGENIYYRNNSVPSVIKQLKNYYESFS